MIQIYHEIAEEFGTPVFVYDVDKITAQYERFVEAFDLGEQMDVFYACKALNNPHILKHLKSLGAGIDAVSINEMLLAQQVGFSSDRIILTPNMIRPEEIDVAVSAQVKINVGSIPLLEYIAQAHPEYPVGIRINPHIMAGGHKKISTGHIDSKFGISIHQWPLVRRLIKQMDIRVEGLHMHNGSDILDSRVFLRAAELLFNLAEDLDDRLSYMDFGSGFKVAYRPDDPTTDMEELGQAMRERFLEFCDSRGKALKLYFEPGKYLVSEAGLLICRCNQVKETTSNVFVGVDSGLSHLLRPMLYDAYHHISNLTSRASTNRVYTIVGQICETDTFGTDRMLPITQPGDLMAIHNAGAYGYVMSSNYNGLFRPPEVMIARGEYSLIRSRETFSDLTKGVPAWEH